jgi:exodeoxyribonuclease VII small subunit
MTTKRKYTDFESAMNRLQELTTLLESGEAKLENAIDLYTEGLEIVKFCNQKLSEAEKKIKLITEQNGQTVETDFEGGTS